MSEIDFNDSDLMAALRNKTQELRDALLALIGANLSGGVLHSRSGALAASITSEIDAGDGEYSARASSSGVAYAAIQEFGGKTAAHEIVAVKGKALAFAGAGGNVIVKKVHHPGSNIPARSYLGSALTAMRDEIGAGYKQAVFDALNSN
jgi:phage gpG-like protein